MARELDRTDHRGAHPEALSGSWAYGIPTREDVPDTTYQRNVWLESLSHTIDTWPPVSTTLAHNHIVHALRAVGENVHLADTLLKSDDPAATLTPGDKKSKFLALLKPSMVSEAALWQIYTYEQALSQAEPYLDRFNKPNVMQSNYRIDDLPRSVRMSPDPYLGWKYEFIPSDLLHTTVLKLIKELVTETTSDHDPLKQLSNIWKLLQKQEQSPLNSLLSNTVRITIPHSSHYYEQTPGYEAYTLAKLNEAIASVSDVYVRFDGAYLAVRTSDIGAAYYPFQSMTDLATHNTQGDLFNRTRARDHILRKLERNRKIVINGISLDYHDKKLESASVIPQWIVDLLGYPVWTPKVRLDPGAFASNEMHMVHTYRTKPTPALIDEILRTYGGFEQPERISSKHDVTDLIDYTLKETDIFSM